ncbi:MAG: hypothetical protein A4E72_00466 [Syntrophus sp. PtaU1.Bin208]|nr:MAG: hypothetical protein A4E72_00466 [Syntrophus sp. PtaU1.Bin208]
MPAIAGGKKTPVIHPDVEGCPCHIIGNDPLHGGPHLIPDGIDLPRVFQHLLHRPEVPKGGIYGVVSVLVPAFGKEVGQQPVFFSGSHRIENIDSLLRSSGAEGQSRQRDQPVPSPVLEPVVTGDNAGASRRRADQKLLPGKEQTAQIAPVFLPVELIPLSVTGFHEAEAAFLFDAPDFFQLPLKRRQCRRHNDHAARLHRNFHNTGAEKVFPPFITAPFFKGVFKIPIPNRARGEGTFNAALEKQRRKIRVGLHAETVSSFACFNGQSGIFLRQGMMIAESDKRPQSQDGL